MANEISSQVFTSAQSVYPFIQPSAEPKPPVTHIASEASPEVKEPTGLDNVKKMLSELADVTRAMNRRLKFEVDLKNHDIIVKVIDPTTDKVIRELPPAELEKLHKSLRDAVGHLINELI